MILYPNFEQVPDEALPRTLRRVLAAEPRGPHSVVDCWNPECETCRAWRVWAREVTLINYEIESRKPTNKKA